MKLARISLFLFIILLSSCEKAEDNKKYNPLLTVRTIMGEGNYYDVQEPRDTFRIGSHLTLLFNGQSNGLSNSYIRDLHMIDRHSNLSVLDTVIDLSQFTISRDIMTPLNETVVNWNVSIVDHIGNKADTTLEFYFDNKGLVGRWYFPGSGIKGSYKLDDRSYGHLYCSLKGKYEFKFHAVDSSIIASGMYNQEQQENNSWSVEFNQHQPDTMNFAGVYNIVGAQKDSIEMYFVQTFPDMGLSIPEEIEFKDQYQEGEYYLSGVFN